MVQQICSSQILVQWKFKGKSKMTLYLMFSGNKLCILILPLVLPPRKYCLIEQPDSEACPPRKYLRWRALQ